MGAAGVTAGAAVVGAGASAYGALSKKSGGSTSSAASSGNAPWSVQQPYDANAMQSAQTVYHDRLAQGPYQGETVAGPNDIQGTASNVAGQFNQGYGAQLPQQMAAQSSALSGATQPYVNNATNIAANGNSMPGAGGLYGTLTGYGTGANSIQGATPELSGALNSAAIQGANSLAGFNGGLQQVQQKGLGDATQQIAGDAGTYMNSAPIQQAMDATHQQINQTLHQSTLPGLNQSQAANGQLNSSRAGMAEGMARQAAATSEGQADASILNNAYNSGMSTAANTYNSGLQAATSAGMYGYNNAANMANGQAGQQIGLNEANAANQVASANSGLNYGLNNSNLQLNGNQQLGNAAQMGINGAGAAINAAGQNFNLGASAGNLQQAGQQAVDQNAYNQYTNSNTYGQNILQNYFGIVSTPLGSQGYQQQQADAQNPSNILGGLAGGAAVGNGLYQNYQSGQTQQNNAQNAAYNSNTWDQPYSPPAYNGPTYTDNTSTWNTGGF